jgi:hypothetical protein
MLDRGWFWWLLCPSRTQEEPSAFEEAASAQRVNWNHRTFIKLRKLRCHSREGEEPGAPRRGLAGRRFRGRWRRSDSNRANPPRPGRNATRPQRPVRDRNSGGNHEGSFRPGGTSGSQVRSGDQGENGAAAPRDVQRRHESGRAGSPFRPSRTARCAGPGGRRVGALARPASSPGRAQMAGQAGTSRVESSRNNRRLARVAKAWIVH